MNDRHDSPGCERAPDLIAFLYGEADERELRDFQLHMQQCSHCCEEAASLGIVRESITAWRDEALAGFVSTPVVGQPKTKSAMAALRQFFDLSPLWLKGATAFAAVAFCVLAGLALFRSNDDRVSTNVTPGPVYTEQDVNRMVKEALAQQSRVQQPAETPSPETVAVKSPRPKAQNSRAQFGRSQRPLSKAEREQLAAALRLLSSDDEATLHLLGDRINQ